MRAFSSWRKAFRYAYAKAPCKLIRSWNKYDAVVAPAGRLRYREACLPAKTRNFLRFFLRFAYICRYACKFEDTYARMRVHGKGRKEKEICIGWRKRERVEQKESKFSNVRFFLRASPLRTTSLFSATLFSPPASVSWWMISSNDFRVFFSCEWI